ncbi:hypothetical protein L2E82_15240 [Cichorium intybus]|uniref:Uncharacterized protein n=1 Tax=Cichorium intybus TaxID=13427 RepID=A0ACB9F271_CICIN|nr:hypothetical protein L2E82_15240 [Cichorium intybus]
MEEAYKRHFLLSIVPNPKSATRAFIFESENLQRKLNWLIEDALQNPKSLLTLDDSQHDTVLQLRANFDGLYSLWKQRIDKRRSKIELIIDVVDDAIKKNEEFKEGLWGDLGTGSDTSAIGIKRILGDFGRVIATDLSPIAVQVASFNMNRHVHMK